ncbi:thiopurine S-methyltransferase-like isoform X2 [Haliotis rubra]|uniref:thiopurine S-methyltransferase-like isoform X1 n=1 Tax=Haliotis rubra TaxID=36100 RepID=UPI001EE4EE33|nr:thiopurine S-methyltransferase-like isoform X1 [Haliotis rubra]XP_046566902.1 thiopurine S-methyltransferase-like isoform X1 [Haliotis rubra]XP_046566903.1 thiopurine S-methyltransferase-like isoform X1 [Haliotis rubra]XP_046566904.1 thiopurine S-methyltransferase-like isoform X1 [Haliotis rubra]XP_046566905.1 thiopurine S-methyltransferase-like isoform X1 [Haliotis rubra]XP_046566906.1 thiopurine S-methyltransferase-like isoform X1 [Haliotis rubra]XP_046566907.1 thiopurine S-methyltransfe
MSQEDRVPDTPDGRINDWLKGWDQGHWDFTFTEPGQNLAKYFEKVTDGRKGMKVLVPLCATTFDLIWFCERGHTVVGADLAESAAQRIFKQYKQKPIIEDAPSINGKLYKNASGNFKFYVGNFFRFNENLEGKFDFVWDAGAMCAVDERDRDEYMKAVRGVMGPKCITMLEFPKKGGSGAPYHFSEGQLKELYVLVGIDKAAFYKRPASPPSVPLHKADKLFKTCPARFMSGPDITVCDMSVLGLAIHIDRRDRKSLLNIDRLSMNIGDVIFSKNAPKKSEGNHHIPQSF